MPFIWATPSLKGWHGMKADLLQIRLVAASIGVAALIHVAPIQIPWLIYCPWLVSVLLWGLPHGAADHIVWSAVTNNVPSVWSTVRRYLAIMVIYGGLWLLHPTAAALLFLLMTTWHWGSADAYRSFERSGVPIRTLRWFVASTARGLIPILAPVVVHRETVVQVLVSLSPGLEASGVEAWWPTPALVTGLLVVSVVAWLAVMHSINADLRWEAFESALLIILLVAVHPIASVGVYFTFWHAIGHETRLKKWYSSGRLSFLENRSLRWDQAIIMAITWLGLGIALAFLPMNRDLLAFYLIAISIMTLPHMIVVWQMDAAEPLIFEHAVPS